MTNYLLNTKTNRKFEIDRRYRLRVKDTPLYKYKSQRLSARRRGIQFLLTFEEWWRIWQDSGHWAERGLQRGQYVMARLGDQGPYAIGNIVICRTEENGAEPSKNKRISEALAGRPKSKQHCKKLAELATGRRRVYLPDGSWIWGRSA